MQVTVDGCPSDLSDPAPVVVNPRPQSTASNNGPICAGESVQLFAGSVPDGTYQWYDVANPGLIVSTEQNPVIFNLTATTTYEVVVSANGCISDPNATTTVTVNENPTPAPTFTYTLNSDCSFSDATLMANPAGGSAPYTFS